MNKAILISTEVYTDLVNKEDKDQFILLMEELIGSENGICFISRDSKKLSNLSKEFNNDKIFYKTRPEVESMIKRNKDKKNYFVVIGNRDKDFETAVNNKFLYLVPLWTKHKDPKCIKYGVHINSIKVLGHVIKTVNNQNKWYYRLSLDDGTEIYSLISAHTRKGNISREEKELVEGFEKFLKQGNTTYYEILLYHFLASIANNNEFRDVNVWGIVPSSGLKLNQDMLNFKEKARYCMKGTVPRIMLNGSRPNNLFIRHKAITKSRWLQNQQRIAEGSTRHFDSIVLDDAYKGGKLKGKVVCVFDDYLTNGNTLESIRSLLKNQQVKKIIFVTLGRFSRDYFMQDYDIKGDVFTPNGYTYNLKKKCMIGNGIYDDEARVEVKNLYDIFNL